MEEELEEFKLATSVEHKEQEFGDLLFALVNYARVEGINPDDALEYTNKKFKSRFEFIERRSKENSQHLPDLSLNEMDEYWEESKKTFK